MMAGSGFKSANCYASTGGYTVGLNASQDISQSCNK